MEKGELITKEEKGVTLGKIFKVAFGRWKLFVPVAVATAAVCAVGIHFGLNPSRGKYTSTFSYSSADIAEGKYADGSTFFYQNLVSYNNLKKIQDQDSRFASIDINKLLDNNGIAITSGEEANKYTITIAYRFIKDTSLAKDFVINIANSALVEDAYIINNGKFDNSLVLFDNADSFEEQIIYLSSQADYLHKQYEYLIDSSRRSLVSISTSTIEQATANNQQLSLIIPDNFVSTMNYRISKGGFVKDYDSLVAKNFDSTVTALTEEYNENEKKIAQLTDKIKEIGTSASISNLSYDMEKFILRNEDIQYELNAIALKKANKDKSEADIPGLTEFKNDLQRYRDQLSDAIQSYRDLLTNAYADKAEVTFENSSVITLSGTVSIYVNGAISLLIGVVVGAVVNLIVDRKKLYE